MLLNYFIGSKAGVEGLTMYKDKATCSDAGGFVKEINTDSYKARFFVDPANCRLRVQSYKGPDLPGLARALIGIAREHQLSKVIFYALEDAVPYLEAAGYLLEGRIVRFFAGREAFCYSYFVEPQRGRSSFISREDKLLALVSKHKAQSQPLLPEGYMVKPLEAGDVEALVQLYRTVFSSYPSPLLDPEYVKKVMASHVYFLAAFHDGRPVSAASAEIDHANLNAEMTDCATLSEHRGSGLLTMLLDLLEKEMWKLNMGVIYSLSRAGSFGMNASLHRLGYVFKGRFINNCHIDGRFENMNLWVKTEDSPH